MSWVILFCLQVDGLTFKQTETVPTQTPLCKDEEINYFMTPCVRSIQNFFEKEEYSFYPFALSAIGALRYGGNSVVVNNKRHLMDHDVDFLMSPHSDSIIMNITTVNSLVERLLLDLSKSNIFPSTHYWVESDIFVTAAVVLSNTDMGPNFYPAISVDKQGRNYSVKGVRLITPPNDLTRKLIQEMPILAFEMLQRSLPASSKTTLQLGQSRNFIENIVLPNIAPQESPSFTHFDLFFSPDANQEELQASKSKKVMFYGVTMHYPIGDDITIRGVQMSAWNRDSKFWRSAQEEDMCRFHFPSNIFLSDAPAVSEEFKLAQSCSRALSEHGYHSLAYCF